MQAIKYLQPQFLYNMLQDFRHLLIFDLRSDFEECHIRDAFHVLDDIKDEEVIEVIELAQKKATEKQKKYPQLKRVRRYFFLDKEKVQQNSGKVSKVLSILTKHQTAEDKIYSLNEGFDSFYQLYPYMCLQKAEFEKASDEKQKQKLLVYPYAKFPAEIIHQKLYLGNVYSSNSEKQLQDLKIQKLVDFIHYNEEEKVPSFKEEKYGYMHFPFSKDVPVMVDFDVINAQIDAAVSEGRTLLYCRDGETISAAFAIAYLMYKANLDIQMATLKVCQAISRTDINKWIYAQLLTYKPKK